jgi:UvrD-like helicase C-terminal domain
VFRVGDKVTQLRNNYNKGKAGIFNGTVGVVTGLSLQEQTLTLLTDEDEPVDYDFAELDELAHAYAVTIHRSQGSEYPAVVIPLTASSWMNAAAQPALHRRHPRQEAHHPRRIPPRPGPGGPHPRSRPPPHRAHPPAPPRRVGERTPAPGSE